ncbi:ClpP/crotonase, partial [Dacryopinax primogenitus]
RFWEELGATFQTISDDPTVRIVVLASSLKHFTAGLDHIQTIGKGEDEAPRRAIKWRRHISQFQAAISSIEECTQPVIGAVHGLCYGLGIDILCACDIRYCATDARFSIKEIDVGLAADIGSLARLPKIVGNASAVRELALTAREFDCREAERLGFVSRVVQGSREEVIVAACETARVIASKSPIAIMGTKHLLNHARDHSVRDNLEYTVTWNATMLQSTDMAEAMEAFRLKRPPKFANLGKL